VARPELARPLSEAPALLARLAARLALVRIVYGRRASDIRQWIAVPAVHVFGVYGLGETEPDPALRDALPQAEVVAASIPGVWVEDKGQSLALHYRSAPIPGSAERVLRRRLGGLADRTGLSVLTGKMVLELTPRRFPGKGALIEREAATRVLEACLYAGDDVADLEAFAALDRLRAAGVPTLKVAVRLPETPGELLVAADVVVNGPAALLDFLEPLAAA
jgi:trehalose 6-phosphate phosphatase